MYSTVWCGYCKRLKIAMKSAGISFTEVDIEHDPAAAEYVMNVNGGNQTVPTIEFADGTGWSADAIAGIWPEKFAGSLQTVGQQLPEPPK